MLMKIIYQIEDYYLKNFKFKKKCFYYLYNNIYNEFECK